MTLSELFTQQVLNNVAMFVQNPSALPFFAFPNQGTTQIQDTGNIGNPGYTSANFATSPFALNGARQASENWVLVPVTDPDKLALMRCAYQDAILPCTRFSTARQDCPDCRKLRADFHGKGDDSVSEPCLDTACWFYYGCKKHVPKNCGCPYVGGYCGLYVWVPPDGRDMLTRLTLTILNYAVNDAIQFESRTKDVEIYVDGNGQIVNGGSADAKQVRKLSATIPIDEPSESVALLDTYAEFLRLYKKDTADRLQSKVPEEQRELAKLPTFWRGIDPKDYAPDTEAAAYVKAHGIVPGYVPSDRLLRSRSAVKKRGTISEGLQQIQQRLNAVEPRSVGQ